MSTYLFLLLILACPLLMWLMMRGGHGGHAHGQGHGHGTASIDELLQRRDSIDQEIAVRERPREDGRDAAVTEA